MFSIGMRESEMTTFTVEESYHGMLRLLTFIYNDTLGPANDDTLLEDLISADRYVLIRMKSMLKVISNRRFMVS